MAHLPHRSSVGLHEGGISTASTDGSRLDANVRVSRDYSVTKKNPISIRELNATAHPPMQHNQLMSERSV
jgi:hypothetical protein